MRRFLIILCILSAACSKKSKPADSAPADPAAFLKTQGSFCTVEKAGKAVPANIEQYEEVFVFGRDNSLSIMTFDLDSRRRLQFDAKGQPKMKEATRATFQLRGEELFLKVDGKERKATLKRVTRGTQTCFELQPGHNSTVHCPCVLPEKQQ